MQYRVPFGKLGAGFRLVGRRGDLLAQHDSVKSDERKAESEKRKTKNEKLKPHKHRLGRQLYPELVEHPGLNLVLERDDFGCRGAAAIDDGQ